MPVRCILFPLLIGMVIMRGNIEGPEHHHREFFEGRTESFPNLAAEPVRLRFDVIVAPGLTAVAAKGARLPKNPS
jgi:hypothetical protein